MKQELIDRLNDFFKENPVALGKKSTLEEIIQAEKSIGIKFDPAYALFLLNWGGCVVVASEIYGFKNCEFLDEETVIDLNETFREDDTEIPSDWLIIGSDHAGNPVAIDKEGKLLVKDYDLGEVFPLADSFEEYLEKSLHDS